MTTKTIVVAGAGRGLGRALALLALQRGYDVLALARTQADLDLLQQEAKAFVKAKLAVAAVDLSDEEAVRTVITSPVRALVCCAATWTGGRAVSALGSDDYRRSFDLNFFSSFNPIKAVLDRRSPTGDLAIVTVGATASLRGGKNSSAFATAKGALRSLSQSLAKEMGPQGVHVTHVVIDGLIDNKRTRDLNPGTNADKYMQPDAIAGAILNLVEQSRDCWTFELDVRPFNETW